MAYEKAADLFLTDDAIVVCQDNDGKNNLITIAWKSIGNLWGIPVITIAVKPSRYSHKLLSTGLNEFSINFGGVIDSIMGICGSFSGRNVDKVEKAGVNLIMGKRAKIPYIEGAQYAYLCKIIHTAGSGSITDHTLFFGEILEAYEKE